MPLAERRYDRLAVRLSMIISRLVAGETLNMQKLATEFDVSVRTLYRDFRERLIYLDLECHQGCYRLRSGAGPQGELDVLTFAHRTGIAGLFPGLDRRLVSLLLNCEGCPLPDRGCRFCGLARGPAVLLPAGTGYYHLPARYAAG